MDKISIRFFDDREVRAVWDDVQNKWWFSVLDIIMVLTDQNDYNKARNYWKYLKAKFKKQNTQLGSVINQFKLVAADGKKYRVFNKYMLIYLVVYMILLVKSVLKISLKADFSLLWLNLKPNRS